VSAEEGGLSCREEQVRVVQEAEWAGRVVAEAGEGECLLRQDPWGSVSVLPAVTGSRICAGLRACH
jgi:hypothetical protein